MIVQRTNSNDFSIPASAEDRTLTISAPIIERRLNVMLWLVIIVAIVAELIEKLHNG